MKKLMTLALAAGMLLGAATGASAIDFKAKGQWLMGFAAGDGALVSHKKADKASNHNKATNTDDTFSAMQRLRLQLDAVASESLSGTVYFEIGDTTWGQNVSGGALGADQKIVELKNAYIDWMVPNTDLKFRMGIQNIAMPNVAGGSAVLDDDVAGIVANYQFNENVGLTAVWARPFNDNWNSASERWDATTDDANYHDNVDMFALMVPLTFDGVKVTPWAMYGMIGANSWDAIDNDMHKGSYPAFSLRPYPLAYNGRSFDTDKAYGSAFWAGLPISVTAFDPLNIELDINYGYVESMGRYDVQQQNSKGGDTQREGWLVKALVEYKLDWGTPGIFGWYSSGDDGNVKNGSERMPTMSGCANFMSFMGDGNYGWGDPRLYDRNLTYAGTWGVGLLIHDMSFVEDLKHSFRVAYWGGTNSPAMAKYVKDAYGWDNGTPEGPYLTTNDGLLEFNLVNSYQIYENLEANLELSYIVNMVDDDTWKRSYRNDSYKKQDAWKAQLIIAYTF
ncbi:outer membrane homotrimeric porin [Desulfovibrio piger]|uniref:outer membrane homotrimeric porin n=1 Tax=Desulfovibrio piger TaxID=901 RepID=UPI0026EBC9E9|nr:outer membrane homotrimeric porin [Desulfovibrio piger]